MNQESKNYYFGDISNGHAQEKTPEADKIELTTEEKEEFLGKWQELQGKTDLESMRRKNSY